jgi:hypothetical protein
VFVGDRHRSLVIAESCISRDDPSGDAVTSLRYDAKGCRQRNPFCLERVKGIEPSS